MDIFDAFDGTRLAYHRSGDGTPLICVPGGPMRASAYLGDLGGLSASHSLVPLDLRGTGGSAVPDDPATYRCDRLVAGEFDAALPPKRAADYAGLFPHAEVAVQPGGGHPPWLATTVAAFLR